MDIYVTRLDKFEQREYKNAKSLVFDYTNNQYVITPNSGDAVKYNKGTVLIGVKP